MPLGLLQYWIIAILRSIFGLTPGTGGSGGTYTLTGPILIGDGTSAAPSYSFSSSPTSGFAYSSGAVSLYLGSTLRFQASNAGNIIASGVDAYINSSADGVGALAFSVNTTPRTYLYSDAANTLAQRNGVNAQTFRVYNTYTDASNGEWFEAVWTGSQMILRTNKNGSGSTRQLAFSVGGGGALWALDTVGVFKPGADNTYDLGAAALRIQNFYVGTAIKRAGDNGQSLAIQALSELTTIAASATTDTVIQMPAGAVVLGVDVRVTVVIPTATSFSVGDSGLATRFSTANVSVAANSTDAGTKAGAYYNASALAIRLTMNGGTPAANTGRVRVTIHYYLVTPATS